MSPREWDICPKCAIKRANEITAAKANVAEKYGKVSVDDYEFLKREAEELEKKEQQETMRVNYGVGFNEDGTFACWYESSCEDCDFRFKFDHEEAVKALTTNPARR